MCPAQGAWRDGQTAGCPTQGARSTAPAARCAPHGVPGRRLRAGRRRGGPATTACFAVFTAYAVDSYLPSDGLFGWLSSEGWRLTTVAGRPARNAWRLTALRAPRPCGPSDTLARSSRSRSTAGGLAPSPRCSLAPSPQCKTLAHAVPLRPVCAGIRLPLTCVCLQDLRHRTDDSEAFPHDHRLCTARWQACRCPLSGP